MRKVLSVFIAVCLVLSLCTGVFAPVPKAGADTDGYYTYTVSGSKATITGYTGSGGAVVIPGTLGTTYTVTSIGDYAFYGCTALTSVTIPDSVTRIGDWAFYGCTGLTSVTIGSGVTTIGDFAFQGCTRLTSVTIPDSVTSIGAQAFRDCVGLTSVTIGGLTGMTSIGSSAFSGCIGLTSVTIGGMTSIGSSAFSGCRGLTSVTFGSRVTSIGDYAFYGCTALTSVTIPDSVTRIGDWAFYGCTKLIAAYFLGNAPIMGTDVFASCAIGFTVWYISATTGWTNPWYGYPTAIFSTTTYTLTTTTSPTAGGTIGRSPNAASYAAGTVVTLTASANPGYHFVNWSGDATGASTSTTVTMSANKTVTATFALTFTPATVSFGSSLTPGQILNAGGSLAVPLVLSGDLDHAAYLDLYVEWYTLTTQGFNKIATVQVSPLSASQTYTWNIPADFTADTAYLTASVWRNDGTNAGAGSYSTVRSTVMVVTPPGSVAAVIVAPVAGATITGPTVPVTLNLGHLTNPWGNIMEIWFSPTGAPGSFVKVSTITTGFTATMTTTVTLPALASGTYASCHFSVTVYVGGTTWRTNYSPTFTTIIP